MGASFDTLTEGWAGGVIDPAKWSNSGGTVQVVVPAPAGYVYWLDLPASGAYPHTDTVARYDLTGAAFAVKVDPPNPGQGSVQAEVILTPSTGAWDYPPDTVPQEGTLPSTALLWQWHRGGLFAGYRVAGGPITWAGFTEADQLVRWLRISERDGLVAWDTSLDGMTWTLLAVWAPVFPLTDLMATLRAGHWLSDSIETTPGTARFTAVNLTPERPADPVTVIAGEGMPHLAVDVIPDLVTGTFTLEDSDVDGPDLLGWADIEEGLWLNVVCDVSRVSLTRGSPQLQGVLTQVEAGSCTVELRDTERRFDPLVNADAIHAGTPLRVRAWGYDGAGERWDAELFTGTIDTPAVRYLPTGAPLVTVEVTDVITELVRWRSEGNPAPGVGAGDDLLGRVRRAVAEAGLAASRVALDVDTTGYAATLAPAALADPWGDVLAAAEAEQGRVWANVRNQLVVRTRRSELSGPVRGTLSDVHGDADPGTVHCCYSDMDAVAGPEHMTNRAVGARGETDAPVYVAEDATSRARWGTRTTERRDLALQTDVQAATWVTDLLAAGSVPQLRVDGVTPAPSSADLDSAVEAWPAVCSTDLGDRWAVRYHPEFGPLVDRTVGVLGISHEITPEGWAVRFTTVDAPLVTPGNPTGWFLLDDSDLDSGDVLTPDSGQTALWGGWVY